MMSRRRRSPYDGVVFRKIYNTKNINIQSGYGSGNFSIDWEGNGETEDNGYANLFETNEWTQYSGVFREYRIMYMSYFVTPIQMSTKTTDSNVSGIATCH